MIIHQVNVSFLHRYPLAQQALIGEKLSDKGKERLDVRGYDNGNLIVVLVSRWT